MTTKKTIELVKEGFANGVAQKEPLTERQKATMINAAANAFGLFFYFG